MPAGDLHEALSLIAGSQAASYHHGGRPGVHCPPPRPSHFDRADGAIYLNNHIVNKYKIVWHDETNIGNSVPRMDTDGGNSSAIYLAGGGKPALTGEDYNTAFDSGDATNVNFDVRVERWRFVFDQR